MAVIRLYLVFMLLSVCSAAKAEYSQPSLDEDYLNKIVSTRIKEGVKFYGLAAYYNELNYYLVDNDSIRLLNENELVDLKQDDWFAVVGRMNVLLLKGAGLKLRLENGRLKIHNLNGVPPLKLILSVVSKSKLSLMSPVLDEIRYAHLWKPLSWLAKLVESSLIKINDNITYNWGLAIIVLGVFLKLLLLPVAIMTVRIQRKVSQVQSLLEPRLAKIKIHFDGEEAHERLMAAHKELEVSPFYTLKPLLGSFIMIPVLVAVFNVLGEMPQLEGESFLWMENLIYPDSIGLLPIDIPMFGNAISVLPFLMTIVTIFASAMFQNRCVPESVESRQKRNLYIMGIIFFILFYPFPAAMVLYWALSNLLQIVQQRFIKI